MLREINLDEVSDGKLYSRNDMVRTDCGGCEGCSACCCGMGSSIVLDPMDIYRLTTGLHLSFEELLNGYMELNMADGIILPNLKMSGDHDACAFLNEDGRCRIHRFRPGVCRLFPLGRFYEDHSFKYFLQVHECPKPQKGKVKVHKWLDTPDIKKYEDFITKWHYFLKRLQEASLGNMSDTTRKNLSMYILNHFYLQPYTDADFYIQFDERLKKAMAYTTNV